jgi:flagellar hook assembly protein FlgD
LIIYDITGKPVVTLEDKNKPAGFYNVEWKGFNRNNNIVDNGIYFLRIVAKNQNGTNSLTRKMLLIR